MLVSCHQTYPGSLSQTMKAKGIGDFGSTHGILNWELLDWIFLYGELFITNRQILLIGKHQEKRILQFILVQHPLKFITSLGCDTITVIAVDDEDNSLSILEIMSPQRSNLILTTDIPDGKLNVLVFDRFDIKTCITLDQTSQRRNGLGFSINTPIVGIVVTISPSLSLYRIVVFPAASKPTIKIRISLLPQSLSKSFEICKPMVTLIKPVGSVATDMFYG